MQQDSEQRVGNRERVRRNTVGDLLRRSARRDPQKTAVVYRDLSLTYEQWDDRVNRTCGGLSRAGVRRGDHVAIIGRNSLDFVTLVFSVARMGGVAVPVNPDLSPQDMAYILNHADVRAVAARQEVIPKLQSISAELPEMTTTVVMDADGNSGTDVTGWLSLRELSAEAEEPWWDQVQDDDVAQLLYTSGTESRPKGVLLTHRNVIDQCVSIAMAGEFQSSDVFLHALPFFHSAQLNAFFHPAVYLGATSVILERPDPAVLPEVIPAQKVTLFFAPPTVWIALLRSPQFDPNRYRTLEKAVYGAAIMPVEVLKELYERLPWVRFWNMYGMTEVAPFATGLRPEQQLVRPRSVGKAGLNVEVAILREDGSEAAPLEPGEVGLRTSHALLGYYKDPERTAEAFEHGWFHTGDIGYLDEDGYLNIVDRKKDMIKTGGENVASREVEEALYLHPAVQECAVIGVPDPYWVEAVVACVVLRPGAEATEDQLKAFLKERLSGFKVPKRIAFLDELPKNPSGKILKRALRDEWMAGEDPSRP